MMRKFFAVCLILSLLLSVIPGGVFAAESDEPVLLPDTETEVYIDTAGQIVRYQFTPAHDCAYSFYSVSDEDTYGELYSASGTLLYENDDFYGLNFGIECILTAGETYILAVALLDTAATGEFDLITRTNHDETSQVIQEPSCHESGSVKHGCTICDYEWVEILSPAHDYHDGICTLCGSVMTLSGVCGDALSWYYDGSGKTLTISGTGAMYDYDEATPPWQADECQVAHLVVEDGVTYIGKNAFTGCEMLESAVLPQTLTAIGDNAFSYCGQLDDLCLPEGIVTVGVLAFAYCDQLREVTVPATVTELGFGAFHNCRRLAHIQVADGNTAYASDGSGVLFSKDMTVLIQAPAAMVGGYEIPATVRTVYDSAFSGCNRLAAVYIPNGVTEIGSGAFSGCGQLTFLQIPGSVTNMGESAVSGCGKLKAIHFQGDAPATDGVAIEDVKAVAYYPAGNGTWTEDSCGALSEDVTWQSVSTLAILAQPEDVRAIPGETVTLSVGVAGEGVTYSWWVAAPGSDVFTQTDVTESVFGTQFSEAIAGQRLYCVVADVNGSALQTNTVTIMAMDQLATDTALTVIPESGAFLYFAFTPEYSCNYIFSSQGALDTYCELFDSAYNLLDSNDDGEDENFSLGVYLQAGTTYILGVCAYGEASAAMDVIVQSDHDMIRSNYLPTCTAEGYTCYACAVCGMSYKTNQVPATGHSYQSVIIEATCTEEGYVKHTCTTCGHNYKDTVVASKGHTWQEASCTAARTCIACGHVDGAPLGHRYITEVVAPECLKDGYTAHICTGCGHTYYDQYVTATGHSWHAASCQEPQSCTVCGATTGRPLAHDYHAEITEPGCRTQGFTTYTCTVCGDSYADSYVSATGHSWLAASCTEPMTCVSCGETVGQPLGHYYVQGVCVDCGAQEHETVNITLQYPTLLLEDEIKLNVYFTVDGQIAADKLGLLTWRSAPAVVDISTADAVISGAVFNEENGFYGVVTNGIPAQNLGDAVYFCVYAQLPDGSYAYSKQVSYSPSNYAYNRLNGDAAPAAKALYVAILNYGAAAQQYLDHKAESLVNARLTAAQKALVEDFRGDMVHSVTMPDAAKQGRLVANGGFGQKKPTISLDSAFAVNYYFTPEASVVGDMVFYYWNAEDFGAADVLTLRNATGSMVMQEADGVYSTAIGGVAAKNIDSPMYACGVYTASDGTTYSTGVLPYSIGVYCMGQINSNPDIRPLASAIAVYGYYAAAYFSE